LQLSFLTEEFVVDVGPELFEDERPAIDRDICNPKLTGLGEGALLAGIVKARDAHGGTCPNISEALKISWPLSVRVIAMREKEYVSRL
jgi:hypothetical protein